MEEKKHKNLPENFTLGLAILDLMPVLFFGIAMIMFGAWLKSPLFIIGVILCVIAGGCKVIWKIIIALWKKNLFFLSRQFRFTMSTGFLIAIIGLLTEWHHVSGAGVISIVLASPSKWLLAVTVVLMMVMFILGATLDSDKVVSNWIEECVNTVAQLCLLIAVVTLFYVSDYYEASDYAVSVVNVAQQDVVVEKGDQCFAFYPEDRENIKAGFIFYPGGKVDCIAYAPLMQTIAKEGYFCVLVKMPDNLAVLNMDAAENIRKQYPTVTDWYIGGHSLGGAIASSYLSNHLNEYKGLILMGAYSNKDLSNANLKVLSIYGSEDEVMNLQNYNKYRSNLPADFEEVIIAGGCHSFFGDYGMQEGDGNPSITKEEQWNIVAEKMGNYLE